MHDSLKRLWGRALLIIAGLGLAGAVAFVPAAHAATARSSHSTRHRPVRVSVITPSDDGRAGAGGVFNVDVSLQARNRGANQFLSRAAGYQPFLASPDQKTFGPGNPDPGAPGLVVLLSTTPAMAGGPNTNLAGVFQLNAVERVHGLRTTFNDWQVTKGGFFGSDVDATLTVFVVAGTAPGHVDMSNVHPISNVERVHFHIAG
jgi:hypothetical protein